MPSRRGFTLLIVMFAISMSLVLTYTFVRLQGTEHRVQSNARHDTAALQAARTGASAALRLMSSPNWEGVQTPLRAVVGADADGTLHYRVTWLGPHQLTDSALPEDADGWHALYALVRSEGVWVSNENPEYRVTRTVEVVARLEPRLPGRVPVGSDDGTATDLVPNPAVWSGIEAWSLQARKNGSSLRLEPGCRIDGPIWLADKLRLFEEPHWGRDARAAYLDGLGTDLTDGFVDSLTRWPHPLPGPLVFGKRPDAATREDLDRLRVGWRHDDDRGDKSKSWKPPIDAFRQYTVYRGGPVYRAERVRWALRNATLQPSDGNPLGIFVCDGDLRLGDRVTVVGTLVVRGRVIIEGRDVVLAPFRGFDLQGHALVAEPLLWPRLPAVMAERMEIDRDARVLIDGAVVLAKDFEAELADYEPDADGHAPLAAGSGATAQPTSAIHSEVRLPVAVALPDFAPGRYAIWLGSRQWSRYEHTGMLQMADVGILDQENGRVFLRIGSGLPWHLLGNGQSLALWLSSARRWLPITGIDAARGRIFLDRVPDRGVRGTPAVFRLQATPPATGAWYPIVDYDPTQRTLTVLGEAAFPSAVPFEIAPALRHRADIRGTLTAERHVVHAPPSWRHWDHRTWDERFRQWRQETLGDDASDFDPRGQASAAASHRDSERDDDHLRYERDAGADFYVRERGRGPDDRMQPATFSRWLQDPEHCGSGTETMHRWGLRIRPTLHIWNASSAPLRLELPLFAPYRQDIRGTAVGDDTAQPGSRDKQDTRQGEPEHGARPTTPAVDGVPPYGVWSTPTRASDSRELPFPAAYDLPPEIGPQVSTALQPDRSVPNRGHGPPVAVAPQPVRRTAGRYQATDPQGYRWKVLKWRIVP